MTNLQEIASYDWLAATFQTIGVPGTMRLFSQVGFKLTLIGNPRKLSPPEMPLTLRPDAIVFNKGSGGGTATDPYRFRLEAPLQACLQQHPLISFGHIDVICGLNNLRKLFDFASGKRGNAFRIDIETCGEVLIMTRWESDPKNLTQTSLCRGYGRGFEEACTTQGNLEVDSTSHHRVISYSLGRLNILLQHEVDACDCQCLEQDGKDNTSPTPQHQAWNAAPARLPPSMVDSSDSSAMPLVVVDHGTRHSSACLVEIKSRDKKNARKDDIMVQMWLSGCHRLFLGRHLRGRFVSTDVYQEDITSDIGNWQADHENEISDFVRLLELIRQTVCEAASKAGSGRYALICARGRAEKQLELWRREGGQDMLRQETLSRVQVVPNIAGLDIKTL